MARELQDILQELNHIASDLDDYSYTREASDLRSITEMIRTGGVTPLRVRKTASQQDSSSTIQ